MDLENNKSPELVENFSSAKYILKKWELQYKKENGVRPNKGALKDAPEEVKNAYKIYWKAENRNFSKQTSSTLSQGQENEHLNLKKEKDEVKPNNDSKCDIVSKNSLIEKPIPLKNTWGKHLNKSFGASAPKTELSTSIYNKMADKMKHSAQVKTRMSLKRTSQPAIENTKHSTSVLTMSTSLSESSIVDEDNTICDGKIGELKDPFETKIFNSKRLKSISQPVNCLDFNFKAKTYDQNWINRCNEDTYSGPESPFEDKLPEVSFEPLSFKTKENNTLDISSDHQAEPVVKANFPTFITGNEEIDSKKSLKRKRGCEEVGACRKFSHLPCEVIQTSSKDDHCTNGIVTPSEDQNLDLFVKSHNSNIKEQGTDTEKESIVKTKNNPVKVGKDMKLRNKAVEKKNKILKSKDKTLDDKLPTDSLEVLKSENKTIETEDKSSSGSSQMDLPQSDNYEYDELQDLASAKNVHSKKKLNYRSKEERFNHKIETGKCNENFVKINLKKKVFVRGKKKMNAAKYKRMEWQKKMSAKGGGGNKFPRKKLTCFKCGDFGHFADKCPASGSDLLPLDEYNEAESDYLTLKEAANLVCGTNNSNEFTKSSVSVTSQNEFTVSPASVTPQNVETDSNLQPDDHCENPDLDEILVNELENFENQSTIRDNQPLVSDNNNALSKCVKPYYDKSSLSSLIPAPNEVKEALRLFGFESFRSNQEETIMRILTGQSTLLVQCTGSGKSLCYQLPAYLYTQKSKCICICVSPLVSLMEDQITGLPHFLKAVCLHTQQNDSKREKSISAIKSGLAHILLVSPEAIVSSNGRGILCSLLNELPPIAFVCLDEAHCLSEWSYNFRPSYLQVCRILNQRFNVNTFLGLTATATSDTMESIAKHLHITNKNEGIIQQIFIPENLKLSISRDPKREESLIHLLNGERFSNCSSIIIYCTRREECERIAKFVRMHLVNSKGSGNNKSRSKVSSDAEAYHAGLSGFKRQQIQKNFMSGKLRIVVATVAFGMGIDKTDVQGIIHFNMPRNVESYVQEIGRAGRNGEEAHCHLFIDATDGKDMQELRRHIFSDSVDRFTIRKLLGKIFAPRKFYVDGKLIPCSTRVASNPNDITFNASPEADRQYCVCPGHEIALPISNLVEALDLPEENVQTLLCYLESEPKIGFKLHHHAYSNCSVLCYRGPNQLRALSRRCPPLAVAIALQMEEGKDFCSKNSISFPVVEIASLMDWRSGTVKAELKRLEWDTTRLSEGGSISRSGAKVEFDDLAFRMTSRCDITEDEQDRLLSDIYERARHREKDQLRKLRFFYEVLRENSHGSIIMCCDKIDHDKSSCLKQHLQNYFATTSKAAESISAMEVEQLYLKPEVEDGVRADIRTFLCIHSDQQWTGRAVARVLHGISSPNFPSTVWGKVRRSWRLHLAIDFNLLVSIATKEILRRR